MALAAAAATFTAISSSRLVSVLHETPSLDGWDRLRPVRFIASNNYGLESNFIKSMERNFWGFAQAYKREREMSVLSRRRSRTIIPETSDE